MRVALGADHAGFPLKAYVRAAIERIGHEVLDCGTDSEQPVDFPDITAATCEPVLDGRADRAVLVCGTGAGWLVPRALVEDIVDRFLSATFDDDEDTRRRVAKLHALEHRSAIQH